MTAMTKMSTTTTQMEPSRNECPPINSRTKLLGAASATKESSSQEEIPRPRPDEPNVYELPNFAQATYLPLPWWGNLLLAVVSMWIGAVVTWKRRLLNGQLLTLVLGAIQSGYKTWNYAKLTQFLATSLVVGFVSNLVLQEVCLPPTRLSMQHLLQQYFLPSRLSKFRAVNLPNGQDVPLPLGVHYLESQRMLDGATPPAFPISATHLNHGFGASSLSWLPAIPELAQRTGSRVILSHDAPGFGFTERKEGMYTTKVSSEIGLALLEEHRMAATASRTKGRKDDDILLLVGHSMGCRTTVRMALAQPQNRTCWVVLVAPALGLMKDQGRGLLGGSKTKVSFLSRLFVRPPLRFFLRRLVGRRNFWLNGLKMVWGDPTLVSASDALRFQWPSIGEGWEDGLLDFSATVLKEEYSMDTDLNLVRQLLQRPSSTTRVIVMCGSKDPVITEKMLQKNLLQHFPSLQETLVRFDGCGHDPFEENMDYFCDELEKVLNAWNQER